MNSLEKHAKISKLATTKTPCTFLREDSRVSIIRVAVHYKSFEPHTHCYDWDWCDGSFERWMLVAYSLALQP